MTGFKNLYGLGSFCGSDKSWLTFYLCCKIFIVSQDGAYQESESEKNPKSVFKRRFNILNWILVCLWLLLIVDHALPRRETTETVTELSKVMNGRTGRRGRSSASSNLVIYTTGPKADVTEMTFEYPIDEGDTLRMETTPIFNIAYGITLRDKNESCCKYASVHITLKDKTEFLVVCGIAILFLLMAMIPSWSFTNRGTAAFLAYALILAAYKYFKDIHF